MVAEIARVEPARQGADMLYPHPSGEIETRGLGGLVFLSHVAEDGPLAMRLAENLDAAGVPTWTYERDSIPGPSYLSQIMDALAQSSAMVVLVSPAALASWQVDKEVVQAHERGLPFLPLLHGVTYEQVRVQRPEWTMAFGAAVALPLPAADIAPLVPHIVAGIRRSVGGSAPSAAPVVSAAWSSVPVAAPPAETIAPAAAMVATSGMALAHSLPVPPTPLIDRDREMADLTALLRQPAVRLVTLTGPGGVGKTRLALEVAAGLRAAFRDGVAFVALAPLCDAALVPATIAHAVGVTEVSGQPLVETLRGALREREMLLVLDNCEQVVAAAPVVAELLAACPTLTVLATSRVPLHVRGEHESAIPPLAVPDRAHWSDVSDVSDVQALSQYAAVALFIARAQEVKAGFALTAATAPAVAEICARLDGLPLAIELAAARIRLFTPQALLVRLSNGLAVLTGGARDLPARQQTLRATIDWSYSLLGPDEQTLFARLAVFVAGQTLEAIEAVCNPDGELDVLAGVESLLEQSLLGQREVDGEPRIVMLQTIYEYAQERLAASGERAWLQAGHAAYYLLLAEQAEPELTGSEQALWLERLEREHDNLRAALQWALDAAEVNTGLRIAAALMRFWVIRGYLSEGRAWLDRLLSSAPARREPPAATPLQAKAYRAAGALAFYQGDFGPAAALDRRGLALYRELGDREGIAAVLHHLGNAMLEQGDQQSAAAAYEESLALRRALDDRWGISSLLNSLGILAWYEGNLARATALYEESLALKRALGDARGAAVVLNNLGSIATHRGVYGQATALLEESLSAQQALGDKQGSATAILNLGQVARYQGAYDRATALYEGCLSAFRELGDQEGIANALMGLGSAALRQGNHARAAALSEEGLRLFRAVGDRQGIAGALGAMGDVEREQGNDARAMVLYAEGLELFRAVRDRMGMVSCLEGLAAIAVAQHQAERAARLGGAAAAQRAALDAPRPPAEQDIFDRTMTAARTALGDGACETAWSAGQALSLEQIVAEALGEQGSPSQ